MRSTYSGHPSDTAYRSALICAALLGMAGNYRADAGRLEDGIAEELQAADAHLELGAAVLEVEFTAPGHCSHGLIGIFGSKFCTALAIKHKLTGKRLMVSIPYVATPDRVTFGEYRFQLV